MHDCPVCAVLKNPTKTPGQIIKEYRYWALSHIKPPIPLSGWMVLSSKRHVESIYNLSKFALLEYGEILHDLTCIMREQLQVSDVFNSLDPRMSHVHFHFIPIYPHCGIHPTQILPNRRRLECYQEFAVDPDSCMPLIEKIKQSL